MIQNIQKLEDILLRPGVNVDAFYTIHLNQGVTLTLDLPTSDQVISGGLWLFRVHFIKSAQVVHEIWYSQDLISTACCDLDL